MDLRDQIKRDEGYSSAMYRCPAGYRTIGWGHNVDVKGLPKDIEGYLFANGFITPAHAVRLLSQDILDAARACQRLYPAFDTFSQARRDALINFLFNLGEGTARKFKRANAAINMGDWNAAAHEMYDSKWFDQVGARAERIVKAVREG